METTEIAKKIVDAAIERQAGDILMLDLRGISSFTDYFVICSGDNERQLKAICKEIDSVLATEHIVPRKQQGDIASGWVIIDLGNIVVHVFDSTNREYYDLEKLWGEGSTVVRIP